MWNEEYVKYWSDKWDYAMAHTENFSAEIRSESEKNKSWNNTAKTYDLGMGSDISRVEKAFELISKKGYMGLDKEAVDIGSGTGIFTIPLAKAYKFVTSVDVSDGMQNCIRDKATAAGLSNIKYINENWHELDIKNEKIENKFDLVLSSINCRGVNSFDAINKMNKISKAGCCLITWAGPGENNHSKKLNELVLGRQLKSEGGNDIIIPFNIIYSMGGMPELTYADCKWEKKMTFEGAVKQICANYWRFTEINESLENKIKDYVESNIDNNGFYVEKANHTVGVMVWDAWRIKE